MGTTLDAPRSNSASLPGQRSPGEIEKVRVQVWRLLEMLYPHGSRIERRSDNRFPYPYLVYLTPVGADGATPQGESIVVVGKHLSDRGFDFYHPQPLPYRRVIASLEAVGGARLAFLMDLNWCRFTRQSWYESGGRFLQVVPLPIQWND